MTKRFQLDKIKRFDKISRKQREGLTFDLINAFAIVRSPTDSALLLHDLLTKWEINNLGKRLAIAKLILIGRTQKEITNELHCSFGTIARVNAWLVEGGQGLTKVISKLPKRSSKPKTKRVYPAPNLPKILISVFQEIKYKSESKTIENFLDSLEEKHIIDKEIKRMVSEKYKTNLK